MVTIRQFAIVSFIAPLVSLGGAPQALQPSRACGVEVESLEKEASFARQRGEYATAAEKYAQLRVMADKMGQVKLVAKASHNEALVREELVKQDPDEQHKKMAATAYAEAIRAYQAAIAEGNGEKKNPDKAEQALLCNNLATIFIKQRRADEAISYLRDCNPRYIKAEHRYVYDYNVGRAYQLRSNYEIAYDSYVAALGKNPRLSSAVLRAFEVLQATEKLDTFTAGPQLLSSLLSRGQVEPVRERAIELLVKYDDDDRAAGFLTVLVQSYVQSYIDPAKFKEAHWPQLAALSETNAWKEPASEILRVYNEDFRPVIKVFDGGAVATFPYWSNPARTDEQRAVFSALLQRIGDYYIQLRRDQNDDGSARALDPKRAFARYMTAWMIDQRNTESAMLAASVLRDYAKEIDPEGVYYEQLNSVYFDADKTSYRLNFQRIEDWENIRAMHFMLSEMFEQDRAWETVVEQPRSAVFQLWLAVLVERKLAKLTPSPTINMHLALALENSENPKFKAYAGGYYAIAAQEFVKRQRMDEAAQAITSARRLGADVTVVQRAVAAMRDDSSSAVGAAPAQADAADRERAPER